MSSSQAEGAPAFWVMVARTGGGGSRQGADDIISMIHDVRGWQGDRERHPSRPRWSGTGAGRGLEEEEEDAGPVERRPQLVAAEPFLVLVTY